MKKKLRPLWKIEKIISKGDYNYAIVRGHPNATKNHYVLEHRIVMENKIGRILKRGEIVHHINEKKKDNRPENLQLIESASTHTRSHSIQKGSPIAVIRCFNCGIEFERRMHNTWMYNRTKYKVTCCSPHCRGVVFQKLQVGRIKKSALYKSNIKRVFRRFLSP
jgi:hypothetical protein